MRSMLLCLPVLLLFGCAPAEKNSSDAPGSGESAGEAEPLEPLDLSDTVEVRRQLDAMPADQVARYLADSENPEFSWAMDAMRRKGAAAIPHMVKLMGRDDLHYGWTEPMLILLEIGDESLPAVIDLLKNGNRTARRNAAWVLVKRNKPCKEAIAPLIEIIKSDDDTAAGYAAGALIPDGKDAVAAVPHLIPLAFRLRNSAAPVLAIEAIGLPAKFIPAVVGHVAVDGGDLIAEGWRAYMGASLLAAGDRQAAIPLAEAMGHENRSVKLAVAMAVQKLGGKVAADELENALNAAVDDDAVRAETAAALVAIGASAKKAVPSLMQELESARIDMQRSLRYRYECRAAEVLASIPEAFDVLVEGLSSDKMIVRIGCVWAMPDDEARADKVVAEIKKALARSTDATEQELIVEKLYRHDPDWVLKAAGCEEPEFQWRGHNWRDVAARVASAAKKELEEQTE